MKRNIKMSMLDIEDCQRIHDASLKILNETGIVFSNERALNVFKKHGVKVEGEVVFIDPQTVKNALETAPSSFKLHARDETKSLDIGGGKDIGIPGPLGPIYVQDLDNGRRDAVLQDVTNLNKIYQASDVVNMSSNQIVVPVDVPIEEIHLRVQHEIFKHCNKPFYSGLVEYDKMNQILDMTEIAMGGKGSLDGKVYTGIVSSSLSPMKWSHTTLDSIVACCERNQFVGISTAMTSGVTSPIRLFGSLVLQNLEILSGIVLTQLINPGNPVSYGSGATVGNLKTAKYSCSSPSRMFFQIATIEMAKKFYNLPARVLTFGSDSIAVDVQSGIESYENVIGAILAGADWMLSEIGTLEGLFTVSYEKTIIDEEIASRIIHLKNGIDVSDDAMSLDIIKDVGYTSTYLEQDETFEYFRDDWYPTVSDWDASPKTWKPEDCEHVLERANKIYKERLENAPETLLDSELDKDILSFINKNI